MFWYNFRMSKLISRIEEIKKVFDLESITSMPNDLKAIQEYYRTNKIPYSIFHTSTDRIYMGISRDGIYKEDDLLGAARIVSKNISDLKAHSVLELATGRGANSYFLAQQFPECEFYGIDISPAQLSLAYKKSKKTKNYHPASGDYHDLSSFADNTFDVVFVVEALCYSTHKQRVLEEVRRVLKTGGRLIIFDGYLKKYEEELTEDEKLACTIVEKGMALADFESYGDCKKTMYSMYKLLEEEDLSAFVIPTMERFERLAAKFFRRPKLARLLLQILPKSVLYNALTGYLLPTTMREGVYCYMLTVLEK